jgi:hypothetical protein
LAIIKDDGVGSIEEIEGKKDKPQKHIKVDYNCKKCKDKGHVFIEGLKVKCGCIVKKELKVWIKAPLNTYLKNLSYKTLGEGLEKALFKNVKSTLIYKSYLKDLILLYFKKGMIPFSYYIVSGDDFTEAYTSGEHGKYRSCESLLLLLGSDNHNKTLKTTILSLILHRERKGLTTWLSVNDKHRNTSSIVDLYGAEFMDLIQDNSFWDFIAVSIDNKAKIIKKKAK